MSSSTLDTDPARVALFIDFQGLRHAWSRSPHGQPTPTELASNAIGFAEQYGRVAVARAYDDWSNGQAQPRAFAEQGIDPRLVLSRRGGLTAMIIEAHELGLEGEHEIFILVANELGILPLTTRLREQADQVVVVGPSPEGFERGGVHHYVPFSEMHHGGAGAAAAAHHESSPTGVFERRQTGTFTPADNFDADDYDWAGFIRLVSWLEGRLPFVGVGYLIKKAMNHDNVGTADMRVKQAIFQSAQDLGLVEVYYKDNIDHAADPVAACTLLKDHEEVIPVLQQMEAEGGDEADSQDHDDHDDHDGHDEPNGGHDEPDGGHDEPDDDRGNRHDERD